VVAQTNRTEYRSPSARHLREPFIGQVCLPASGLGRGRRGTILHTEDGGRNWQVQTGGTQQHLTSVAFVTPQAGWTVGYGGTFLHTQDGGKSWQVQTSEMQRTLTAVSFATPQAGWAVGFRGTILHTQDGGTNWLAQFRPGIPLRYGQQEDGTGRHVHQDRRWGAHLLGKILFSAHPELITML
jgi:hypothetical protein